MSQAAIIDTTRSFRIADLNAKIDGQPRMMDLTLAKALGFARPSNIRRIISRHVPSLKRFGEVCSTVEQTLKNKDKLGGRPGKAYFLNKKQALYICTKSETENATEVTIQMVEVFDAYTSGRIDKPVSVRQHKRRTSTKIDAALSLKRNVDRLEAVADKIQTAQPNMCAMVIDGQSVFVDVNKYDGAGRAVTLEQDGSVRIQNVERSYSDYQPMGVRTALGERYTTPYGTTARNGVTVLGMVIEQGQPSHPLPSQLIQIEHVPVKRMAVSVGHPNQSAPFRDKILALLGTGLSKTEIAEKVGCSYHGVDYWARKARAG